MCLLIRLGVLTRRHEGDMKPPETATRRVHSMFCSSYKNTTRRLHELLDGWIVFGLCIVVILSLLVVVVVLLLLIGA